MKRTLVAVALAVVFVMALAVPALAQSLSLTTTYEMDGVIDLEKQAGHKCNTGAAVMQTIKGSGVMDKTQTINMIEGRIMMEDDNNWVAGATPLTVTTVWDLCAPPKYVYTDEYDGEWLEGKAVPLLTVLEDIDDLVDDEEAEALTSQIWAVQVQADPGYSGNLYQNGVAANGPYWADYDATKEGDSDEWLESDLRGFDIDKSSSFGYDGTDLYLGPDYVGSYFDMEQHARTSMGTLRRYIDISSPYNHGYLMEDMSIVGKSDVQETFSMMNNKSGSDIVPDWWLLF